jgi:hypothetical protein
MRGTRRVAAGLLLLALAGCVAGLPDLDESPSSEDRREYRGPLPAGSYVESCRDMWVHHDRRRLEAECQRRDGRWRATSLDLRQCDRGIVNDDGRLSCPPQDTVKLPAGSYRESCRDVSLDGRQLSARCRRKNGQWRDTQIDLSRCRGAIGNDDGRLTCG